MKLKVLASSSGGNCYLLFSPGGTILIECGIRFATIKKKLNYDLSQIDACIVTHEHMDHAKSLNDLLNHGIDCYTSAGTAEVLNINHHRLHQVKFEQQFKIKNLIILPFATEHDCSEPLGFLIYDTVSKEKLVFATDTYYIRYQFPKVNYYLIECNYSKEYLEQNIEDGLIHPGMRKRLLTAHMSLENLTKYFSKTDLTECRKIILIHLSTNNSSDEFKDAIQKATGIDTEIAWNQKIQLDKYPF
ncbi:MAG: MBL fold metallo-hydrolase [Eubacteriaceae bacterium]